MVIFVYLVMYVYLAICTREEPRQGCLKVCSSEYLIRSDNVVWHQ